MVSQGLPKYGRIVSALQAQIEGGSLVPGATLPSEEELAREFGVSRMTVRQAHSVLAGLGLIERRQGIGTVVLDHRYRRSMGSLTGLAQDVARTGHRPGARVLAFGHETADRRVGEALAMAEGDDVVVFQRLRLANGKPIGLQEVRVPAYLVPRIKAIDLENTSFYELLENTYGLTLGSALQQIQVRLPTSEEADLLAMASTVPVWIVNRLTRLADERPVELLEAVYRSDRISYSTTLVRAPRETVDAPGLTAFLVRDGSEPESSNPHEESGTNE